MQALHPLDYIVVAVYFAIVVLVGIYFGKFIKQAKDYFAAGASVPWWLAGVSLWMASFSAMTFVIYSQLAYKYGFVAITLCWVVIPAMFAATFWFAARWRRTRIMTPLGFIEQRYGKSLHQVFVWTGFPLRMADNSLRILSTAVFLAVAVGQSWFTLETCIIVVGIIMILYTLLGGQWAVLVTDFFQAIILMFAVVILIPLALSAVGGIGAFVEKAPPGFFRLFAPSYGLFDWIMFAIMITISYNASWGLVQKYNCVQTENDAKKVAILMGVLSFLGPFLFFIPAMAGRVLIPELMDKPGGSAEAYVAVSLKVLPIGMMGLMIAGMFSATLSTLGNEYNVLSGILTKDFYGRVIRPDATEKDFLFWGKVNTAIVGSLTILFAIGINYIRGFNLWDIMVKAFGAFGPAIMLPLLAGLYLKRVNSRGALFGIVGGMISGVALVVINTILLGMYADQIKIDEQLSYWLKQGFNSVSIGINILVTISAMWIGSITGKTPDEERARVESFFSRMDIPSDLAAAECAKSPKQSPFMAVGISLIIFGFVFLPIGFIIGGRGMAIDVAAGVCMMVLGLALWLPNRKKVSG
jgi:solute:Na+ symporter, SSS family